MTPPPARYSPVQRHSSRSGHFVNSDSASRPPNAIVPWWEA
ncbi:hypothetical protein [Saccharothrix syringae]|nr:hypothetical protein [Saccharothrix syringae]